MSGVVNDDIAAGQWAVIRDFGLHVAQVDKVMPQTLRLKPHGWRSRAYRIDRQKVMAAFDDEAEAKAMAVELTLLREKHEAQNKALAQAQREEQRLIAARHILGGEAVRYDPEASVEAAP